jgi:peptide/nickel transport system permease protein
MLPPEATEADREAMRAMLGLDRPFYDQFATFIVNALHGNFGISLRLGRPVSDLIIERLPATLELSFVATVIGLVAGIPLGVYTALRRDSWVSRFLLAASLVGVSLPNFLIGIFLILIFAVWLGWLPSFGRGDVVAIGAWTTGFLTVSGWKAIILPAITLGFYPVTIVMRLVRSEMLEVLRTALKNTMVPVITIVGLQLGGIIAFAIITETVFQWPGMGLLFVQAIQFADIPIMAAYLCLVGLIFVVINLVVDLLYVVVDPRLRVERAATAQ